MKKIKFPILLVTLLVVIFNSLAFFDMDGRVITVLFAIAPFTVLWMVYRVLKDGTPADETWDDHFYEDHHYRRNGKEDARELQ